MQITKRVIAKGLVSLSIGGAFSCSRLTDPTYEFMTLQAIDGKPLPVSIRFGPDSATYPVTRGRLGFADASIGLGCRLEVEIGHTGFSRHAGGTIEHPRCETGGSEPVVADAVLTHMTSEYELVTSGKHSYSFAGRVRTKSPGF